MNTSSQQSQIVYEFTRTALLSGWWSWALAIAILVAALWWIIRLYRRDASALHPLVRYTLLGLRLTTAIALVFILLGLQRRAQQELVRQSEVIVLADTSQSMSLPSGTTSGSRPRSQAAAEILADSELLDELSKSHRVTVYAFDGDGGPRALEVRQVTQSQSAADPATSDSSPTNVANPLVQIGLLLVGVGLLAAIVAFGFGLQKNAAAIGASLAISATTIVLGIVIGGGVWTTDTRYSLWTLAGLQSPSNDSDSPSTKSSNPESSAAENPDETPESKRVDDWEKTLQPSGTESRIGDALVAGIVKHDPSTLAGVLLLTDGQNNGGYSPDAAATMVARAGPVVYPIGFGSSDLPVNVRLVDLEAPRRVYPSDKFVVDGVLQASGPKDVEVTVQLLDGPLRGNARAPNENENNEGNENENIAAINNGMEVVDSQRVVLASDGTLTGVRFELEAEVTGKRQLALRVIPPGEDQNRDDNESSARYEVVTEKLKVLTIAGGPMREYRFVGNMLYRDKSIERDTWLQTGAPGISQDADKLLSDFPSTAEELFEYDAIVAFDPDWSQLSTEQIDLMDRWLTRQAGGLILVSGPVYLPQWSRNRTDTKLATVRGFFPVVLATRASLIDGGRQGGDTAWPLRFTPEATKSEFFWIEKTPAESFETWGKFSGVYDYVGVKDAKPGAKVYANFSDDTTAIDDKLPIYLASQFYGSGRVFFQGSGEMWRLRGVNDSYFETYYTKLIRWISQGRLLRDSNRGILLVDRDRAMVGDTITVRAVLNDAQFRPLQVPSVDAILQGPGGSVQTITLEPVPGESGNGSYSGRFLVRAAGTYDLRLTLGDALNEEELTQSVSVRLPMIELERPRRDDQTLSMIAAKTGGEYLKIDEQNASPPAPAGTATDNSQTPATLSNLPQKISPQPQTTLLPGTPDLDFARRHNALLMWLIATCLTYEWVVRRLHRLA